MRWKAICFDIDGTLYPLSEMKKRLFSLFLKHPISSIRYNKSRRIYRKEQENLVIEDLFKQEAILSLKKNTSEEKILNRKIEFEKNIYSLMKKNFNDIKAYSGVKETFKKISEKGIKIGVLSDFPLFGKLEALEISSYCDLALSSCDIGYLKPDSRAFSPLIKSLELKNSDILYVGDSPDKDIVGAKKTGMDAVLINFRNKKENTFGAIEVFNNWTDFSCWIEKNLLEG